MTEICKKNKLSMLIFQYRYGIFLGLFLLNLLLFGPGFPVPDSQTQYQQALSGIYNDHHPVMMAFVWHHLNKICPGFWSMYLIQITLLYLGLYIIWQTAENFIDFKKKPWALCLIFLLPWWPQILLYAIQIQKDNHFTFSYLVVAGSLAYYTFKEIRITPLGFILLLLLLIYGTSVKYQAQFCLPILSVWLGGLLLRNKPLFTRLGSGIIVTLAVYMNIWSIHTALIPETHKSDAWQYVKLFDLAAISRSLDQDLIPPANKTTFYTFDKLKTRFQPNAVDPYVFAPDAILTKHTTTQEQAQLWYEWYQAVTQHPLLYLQHRFRNFTYCLLDRVGYSHVDRVLSKVLAPDTQLYTWVRNIIDIVGYVFFSQLLVFVLGIIYFSCSIIYWRRTKLAPIVFGFTFSALLFAGIIFFMSMAGTPRYTFFSTVMIHGCHLFALGMYLEIKKRKAKSP